MDTLGILLEQVDESLDDLLALEQALVRIASVNTGVMPTGNETPVAELARDWLAEDGIATDILERAPNRGNLIARIEGSSGSPGLMFMSHLDVVPVEDESRWRFPPFSATIADGRVYGRGAFDCKGLLAAQMMAMRLLKRHGVTLDSGLILASGADEEQGGHYGFKWLAAEHPEKIRSPFAVNEGGGTALKTKAGLAYSVALGEKGRMQAEIEVRGDSTHASVPWTGANALYRLAQVVNRIEAYQPERDTSACLFDHLSQFAIEDRPNPENIDSIIEDVERDNRAIATQLRGLSRMTFTPTMVRGGVKSNSVPESVRLTCDIRSLPHQTEEYVRREVERTLEGIDGVETDLDHWGLPNVSPFETPLASGLEEATATVLGHEGVGLIPTISVAFTDSRFVRPLGTVAYGFYGTHPDERSGLLRAHGTDESVSIASLVHSTKIMLALAYHMLTRKE